MHAYLDNAASTRVLPEVVAAMMPHFVDHWANPSSLHREGTYARQAIDGARESIASAIKAEPDELFFTSGATEANNLSILGAGLVAPSDRRHIVVGAMEHHAVLVPAEQMSQSGFSVSILQPDCDGIVKPEQVADSLRPETFLVSLMAVNNEVGTIQPLREISALLNPAGILFHSDAAQALGKVDLDVRNLGVDLMSLSAHKLHGPKGIGALFVRRGVNLKPLQFGGGQEIGLRSGTENVPAIVGFSKAVHVALGKMNRLGSEVAEMRNRLETSILMALPGTLRASKSNNRSPLIANILFPMLDNNYLLNRLDQVGVSVTSGSACASGSLEPSHVLLSMGWAETLARSSVRFSLSTYTTHEEIDYAVQNVIEIVRPFVRSFSVAQS